MLDLRFGALALFLLGAAVVQARSSRSGLDAAVARPPVAKKVPKKSVIHGETRVDDYFWLREKTNPAVKKYLQAENAYTKKVMKPTEKLQAALYSEFLGRTKQTDLSVPYRRGGDWYYVRTEEGKQYPIHCRKKGSLDAPEEILLDVNALARGRSFFELGDFEPSDDGRYLAWTTDTNGYRQYTLHVKDLGSGTMLLDTAEKVTGLAWAADNRTIFYVVEDHAKRAAWLYRHRLGDTTADPLVYDEKDELYRLGVGTTTDRKFLVFPSESSTTSEIRVLPADDPTGALRVVVPRHGEHEYSLDHAGGLFYIRTNDGAKNFRVAVAPEGDPRQENWKEFVPARPGITVESLQLFRNFAVLNETEGGLEKIRVVSLADRTSHSIEFPEPVYSLGPDANHEFDTPTYRFRYSSLVTPGSVYEYDLASRERKLLKRTEVPNYDPTNYESQRVFATAADGKKIPVSLLYRKGTQPNGTNPLFLYGYGSYGFSMPDSFSIGRMSLVDRGVICAVAHVRGGAEMGREWYDDGKLHNKKNTFTDFIASAEYLVASKWADPKKIAISGGSAGGLLMGAVTNMRPDLWRAVVADVPFVDVINTMLDASIPLTVGEYLEWGNPNVKADYDYMRSYCPYSNVAKKDYPPMLVRTSLNDSQVGYWEPAKWVAKLRTMKTDRNPLLLDVNLDAGHGGASGRFDALRERAFEYSFVLWELGREE